MDDDGNEEKRMNEFRGGLKEELGLRKEKGDFEKGILRD